MNFRLFFLNLLANIFLAGVVFAQAASPQAVTPQANTPASSLPFIETHQAFLDLTNDGVLMNISAHPDDEDGATLAYYRMKYGVKTYSILFTRGEGGQNETGPELYEELGVLRTNETLDAGKLLGAEVHFLKFMDFGYSKTATETFKKWGGQQEVLRRLVFAIRKYKPDVIFTNHSTVEGHGHHQVVAISSVAAFDAAADSTMFPEQLKLKGVAPWQPRKLFFRNFGRTNQTADVVNPIGDTNAVREKSYLDIAADALAMHKTQGMDRADLRRFTRGLSMYRLMRSNSMYERDTTTFFGGINLWRDESLGSLRSIKQGLSVLHEKNDSLAADASILLYKIEAQKSLVRNSLAQRTLAQWQNEIEQLLFYKYLCCDGKTTLVTTDSYLTPNQTTRVSASIRTDAESRWTFDLPKGWTVRQSSSSFDPAKRVNTQEFALTVGRNPQLTQPAESANYSPIEFEQEVIGHVRYYLNGHSVSYSLPLSPLNVGEPFHFFVTPKVAWWSGKKKSPVRLTVFGGAYRRDSLSVKISVSLPKELKCEFDNNGQKSFFDQKKQEIAITTEGGGFWVHGVLTVSPQSNARPGDYVIRFKNGDAVEEVTFKVFDVAADTTIQLGIIKSYDNTLEAAAEQLDMKYKSLDGKDLENDLSQFNTIVVDIRAYLVREDLKRNNQKLLEYVKRGGNLVVMYQKDQDWKPEYAPYPFSVTRKRVSVEEAPVKVLQPDHPLFNTPNTITDADWDDWKQERGVYFPDNVSPQYTQLLSSSDPDEVPLPTGYLVASYGSGSYIYTSYVWYRQLKEYNAGAWRNFINMICYPNHRNNRNPKP